MRRLHGITGEDVHGTSLNCDSYYNLINSSLILLLILCMEAIKLFVCLFV